MNERISLSNVLDYDHITARPPVRAVVHMGIHKTGSTSIQRQSRKHVDLLELDRYEMPWVAKMESNEHGTIRNKHGTIENQKIGPQNQVNFATCFVSPSHGERKEYPCDPDLLLHGLDIAKKNRNLLVSAETFSNIDSEGVNMLSSYLLNWDEVIIVVYYHRLHSYIVSSYNQQHKRRILADIRLWEDSII